MVSRGRSIRGRVGFERSGSAASRSVVARALDVLVHTNNVPFYIFVLDFPEIFQIGIFESNLSCHMSAAVDRHGDRESTWLSLTDGY